MKLHTDHIINFESYQMTSFLLKEKSSKQSELMRQDTFSIMEHPNMKISVLSIIRIPFL